MSKPVVKLVGEADFLKRLSFTVVVTAMAAVAAAATANADFARLCCCCCCCWPTLSYFRQGSSISASLVFSGVCPGISSSQFL